MGAAVLKNILSFVQWYAQNAVCPRLAKNVLVVTDILSAFHVFSDNILFTACTYCIKYLNLVRMCVGVEYSIGKVQKGFD